MNPTHTPHSSIPRKPFSETPSLKLLAIGLIALILLIPQNFTLNMIEERQCRLEEAETEVQSKWSNDQTIGGPYLQIPYYETVEEIFKGEKKFTQKKRMGYFLPDKLDISGNLQSETLHRGIFDVAVYTNDLNIDGQFAPIQFEKLNISTDQIIWEEASLIINISDLRGLAGTPSLQVNGQNLNPEPFKDLKNNQEGIQLNLPLDPNNLDLKFTGSLTLRGSKNFFIIPVGKTTKLNLEGNWPSPSFQGGYLPETREINEQGFRSSWQISHLNRPFSQEFLGVSPDFKDSEFGISLTIPANQYQQTYRSSKYALLIIVLSFLALFMMEFFTKKQIHPVQYTLVGFGLVLYYTLLIAFSEHIGFGSAYFIASLATSILLGSYSQTLFLKPRQSILFTAILGGFYSFIFIIIKQQDYALLLGSTGLFIALAITMYLSRKINWGKESLLESKEAVFNQ